MAVPTVAGTGTNTSTNANGTPLSANLSAGVTSDIVVVFIAADGGIDMAANGTGWTKRVDVIGSAPPSSFPTIANTGVPSGTSLTASGGFTASTNNQTYTALDITGNVDVNATGVTFQSCKIRGGLFYALHILAGKSATLNDCEVYGTVAGVTPIYVEGTAVLNRCYVHDGDSLIIVGTSGSNTINESLLTDQWGRNTLATGGRSVTDGATTNGSTTISSTNMAFVAGDIGHLIWGAGIPNETSITAVAAPNCTVDRACTATATGVTLTTNAQTPDGNHCECIKHTGGGTTVVNHSSLWAKWGVNGSNGGGITGCFHDSGGALSVDNSLLVQYDGSPSYICYWVSGYTTASLTNSVLDHYDANHVTDKIHQDSYDGAAPTWTNNKWGDGTVATL